MRRPAPTAPLFPYSTLFRSAGRDEAKLQSAADSLGAAARVRVHPCDVTDKADRKSTRLNSSHLGISYAVFCLKKKVQKGLEWLREHGHRRLTGAGEELGGSA